MKKIIFILSVFTVLNSFSQDIPEIGGCSSGGEIYYTNEGEYNESYKDETDCSIKIIRVNMHFMQKSDGSGNLTATDDGLGGSISGYVFASEMMQHVNEFGQANNVQLNLPDLEGNQVPVVDKNFYYALEGVYFHQDDDYYLRRDITDSNNPYLVNEDSVINIFFVETEDCNNPGSGFWSGSANLIAIEGIFCLLRDYSYPYNWWYPLIESRLIAHELGHALGLSHTVRYDNGGEPIDVEEMAEVSPNGECVDFNFNLTDATEFINYQNALPPIHDTPSPW